MRRTTLGYWIAAALLLVLVDLWVRGFFPRTIMDRYVSVGLLLRDRTNGHNWRVLLDGVERLPRPKLRVGIIGDSTVNATSDVGDRLSPAWILVKALRRRLPGTAVEVVDTSLIGLYANDSVLLVNKLLAGSYDVIVYGLTLRALPAIPNMHHQTHLTYEIAPSELWRLIGVGGASWLWSGLSGSELLGGVVQSVWATYAYRPFLKRYLWEKTAARVLAPWPALRTAMQPAQFDPPPIGVPKALLPGAVEWTREGYDIPNSNWTALEIMGALCQRYGPGRCLIYSGPLNPHGRERLTEPSLYDEYLRRLRVIAGRYDLRFRDFSDTLAPEEFRPPMFIRPDDKDPRDPIHMNEKGAAKVMGYVADTVVDMAASASPR